MTKLSANASALTPKDGAEPVLTGSISNVKYGEASWEIHEERTPLWFEEKGMDGEKQVLNSDEDDCENSSEEAMSSGSEESNWSDDGRGSHRRPDGKKKGRLAQTSSRRSSFEGRCLWFKGSTRDSSAWTNNGTGEKIAEKVELTIRESKDEWHTLVGRSVNKHGRLLLKGILKPSGQLLVYKQGDVHDARTSPKPLHGAAKKGSMEAKKRKVKLTRKPKMDGEGKEQPTNRSLQHIAKMSSLRHWKITDAIRELVANLLDQSHITAQREGLSSPVRVQSTRTKGDGTRASFYAEDMELAHVVSKDRPATWVSSYRPAGNRLEPAVSDSCYTRVLSLTNLGAHIAPKSFLRGHSGLEKMANSRCVGKFGDGMTSALTVLTHAGANVTVKAKGYTTFIVHDDVDVWFYFKTNQVETCQVVFEIVFPPAARRSYMTPYQTFRPTEFEPLSVCLREDVDYVALEANAKADAPLWDRDAVILDDDKVGEVYNRGFFVSKSRRMLFGYNFADRDRNIIASRDRNVISSDVQTANCTRIVNQAARISTRLRRRILKVYRSYHPVFNELETERFDEDVKELIKEQNTIMYPGTVMVAKADDMATMVAHLKGLKIKPCQPFLDEGTSMVRKFADEISGLRRETIPETGWAYAIRDAILALTKTAEMAAVVFPGKLASAHVVWVHENAVLVSRHSLGVDLRNLDAKEAKHLLDVITFSTTFNLRHKAGFEGGPNMSELAFKIYHLVMTAEHGSGKGMRADDSPPSDQRAAMEKKSARSPASSGMESAGSEHGILASSDTADTKADGDRGATPAAATSANGTANSEIPPRRRGNDACSTPETDDVPGREERELSGDERGARSKDPADDARHAGSGSGAATNERYRAEDGAKIKNAEDSRPKGKNKARSGTCCTPVRHRPTTSSDGGPSRSPSRSLNRRGSRSPSLSRRGSQSPSLSPRRSRSPSLDPSMSERGEDGGVAQCYGFHDAESDSGGAIDSRAGPERDQGSPSRSKRQDRELLTRVEDGASPKRLKPSCLPERGLSITCHHGQSRQATGAHGVVVKAEVSPSNSTGIRSQPAEKVSTGCGCGQELEACLFVDGVLAPALIHVETQTLCTGRVHLYRVAGCKNNDASITARFLKVVEHRHARNVLESALHRGKIDLGLFSSDRPNAPRAYVWQVACGRPRLFLNLHHESPLDDWAADDLPTLLAHEMAHAHAPTERNVHDHGWSVEFRKWIRAETF